MLLKLHLSILIAVVSYWATATDAASAIKPIKEDDYDDRPEYFDGCSSACLVIATCQNRYPEPYNGACIDVCVPRSLCSKGYVRKTIDAECIKVEDCPEN